jgi:hypothetical protein
MDSNPNPAKPGAPTRENELEKAQDKIIRELIKKEMLDKIERRIDSEDAHVLKTLRSMIEESPEIKEKMKKKAKKEKEL